MKHWLGTEPIFERCAPRSLAGFLPRPRGRTGRSADHPKNSEFVTLPETILTLRRILPAAVRRKKGFARQSSARTVTTWTSWSTEWLRKRIHPKGSSERSHSRSSWARRESLPMKARRPCS